MTFADLWPTFGQTEPPTTGLWAILRAFTEDLGPRTDGRVRARLDAIKLAGVPLGKAFELRFVATRDPSRPVSMLQVVEQPEGLALRIPGRPESVACTERELTDLLEAFAHSPGVAEMIYVLGGRPAA